VTDANYAKAAIRGILRDPPKIERDEIRELLEAELAKVAEQWRENLGWRATFSLEPSSLQTSWYHIYVTRVYRWWQVAFWFPDKKRLGMVGFHNRGAWISTASDYVLNNASLSQALELFFANSKVGKILSELFGASYLKR